jgi:hypothetical protein
MLILPICNHSRLHLTPSCVYGVHPPNTCVTSIVFFLLEHVSIIIIMTYVVDSRHPVFVKKKLDEWGVARPMCGGIAVHVTSTIKVKKSPIALRIDSIAMQYEWHVLGIYDDYSRDLTVVGCISRTTLFSGEIDTCWGNTNALWVPRYRLLPLSRITLNYSGQRADDRYRICYNTPRYIEVPLPFVIDAMEKRVRLYEFLESMRHNTDDSKEQLKEIPDWKVAIDTVPDDLKPLLLLLPSSSRVVDTEEIGFRMCIMAVLHTVKNKEKRAEAIQRIKRNESQLLSIRLNTCLSPHIIRLFGEVFPQETKQGYYVHTTLELKNSSKLVDRVENVYGCERGELFMKMPFEKALWLVAKRKVQLLKGKALIPLQRCKGILTKVMRDQVMFHADDTAVDTPLAANLRSITRAISARLLMPSKHATEVETRMIMSGSMTGQVVPIVDSIDEFKPHLPACVSSMVESKHLKHWDRTSLWIILIQIGVKPTRIVTYFKPRYIGYYWDEKTDPEKEWATIAKDVLNLSTKKLIPVGCFSLMDKGFCTHYVPTGSDNIAHDRDAARSKCVALAPSRVRHTLTPDTLSPIRYTVVSKYPPI